MQNADCIYQEMKERLYQLVQDENERGFSHRVSLDIPAELKEPLTGFYQEILIPYVRIQLDSAVDTILIILSERLAELDTNRKG